MLAVVKKPHIEISGESIPEELLSFLKDHYKKIEIIEDEEAYQNMQSRSNHLARIITIPQQLSHRSSFLPFK